MAMAAPMDIITITMRGMSIKMASIHHDMMILQNWFSPSFPTGAFSYSHGLETAIQKELVTNSESLCHWIDGVLSFGTGRNDGLFVKAGFEGEEKANDLCLALSASKERWQESMELGNAFSRVFNASYEKVLPDGLAYPVAVGMAAKRIGLRVELTIQSYLQAFAANLIAVGVRIIPIGQQAGQDCLLQLYPTIEKVLQDVIAHNLDHIGGAAMMSDIMAMQHETSSPRIFRT